MTITLKGRRIQMVESGTGKYLPLLPPEIPEISLLAVNSTTLRVKMVSRERADELLIEVSSSATGPWSTLTPDLTATFDHTGLDPQSTWYYRPTAINVVESVVGTVKNLTTPSSATAPQTAGRATITGTGFGVAPNVVLFRRLKESAEGAVLPLAPPAGEIGTFATNDMIGGAVGSTIGAYGRSGAAKLTASFMLPVNTQRMRWYHELAVPAGKSFPGADVAQSFPSKSSLKSAWFLMRQESHNLAAEADLCVPTHIGSGAFAISGNGVQFDTRFWDYYDDPIDHWQWDDWNQFDWVQDCNLADPMTTSVEQRIHFTSANVGGLKPTGTITITPNEPGFPNNGSLLAENAFYAKLNLNSYSVDGTDVQIAFRNLYLAIESAPDAGDYKQMAFLGNAAVFADCTKRLPKIATSWSDTQVVIEATAEEKEEFPYAFVQRADGTIVSAALEDVTLSGTSTDGVISWSALALNHGTDLTITTSDVSLLDERSHVGQLHYQEGDQLWLSGVLQSIAEESLTDGAALTSSGAYPYNLSSGRTVSRTDVMANSNLTYVHNPDNSDHLGFRAPAGQGSDMPIAKTTDRMYCSWKEKQTLHVNKIEQVGYSSITGTFQDGDMFTYGEDINITFNTGATTTGQIIFVDTATSTIFFSDNATTVSQHDYTDPGTIEGVVSGAVAVMDKTVKLKANAWSTKRFRIETDLSPQIRFTVGNNTILETAMGEFRRAGSTARPAEVSRLASEGRWAMLAGSVVALGTDVTAKMRVDAAEDSYGPHPLGINASEITNGINLGPHISNYAGISGLGGHLFKHCNPVYDDEPARVMLGNASTWGACTKVQDCLIREWDRINGKVVIRQNYGDFEPTEPVYFYIYDKTDTRVRDEGVLLRSAT